MYLLNLTMENIVFRQIAQSLPRRFFAVLASAALGLAIASVCLAQQPTTGAMNNEDVIKMVRIGFSDDVIEAKIQQTSSPDFKLEVDDLSKLKSAGVSQKVISAMLHRGSGASGGLAAAAVALPVGPRVGMSDFGRVVLVAKGHPGIDLRSIAGSESRTIMPFVRFRFVNYPGLKSDARVHDPRPSFVLKSGTSPRGRIYLVSTDVDKKNGVRSVKVGNSGFTGPKNIGAPDSSNQIDYDVASDGPTTWRLTLKSDLKPGEYGLWTSAREIYDFGIDP